jgi:hypothetical protein
MLLAEFETADIPLERVCKKYFGLDVPEAKRHAALQKLPVPVFRGGSQKSCWLVNVNDLAKYLDDLSEKARRDHQRLSA